MGDNHTSTVPQYLNSSISSETTLDEAIKMIYIIWTPIILILGIIGNVMVLVVLGKIWRRTRTFLFLIALAITDLIILITGLLPTWMYYLGLGNFVVTIENYNIYTCFLSVWFRFSNGIVSSFFLAGVTVFRAYSVARPHVARTISHRQVIIIIVIITVFLFAFNASLAFSISIDGTCKVKPPTDSRPDAVFRWINNFLFAIVPAVIMMCAHCVLVRAMLSSEQRTRKVSILARQRRHRITKLLIAAFITFLVLRVPTSIVRMVEFVHPNKKDPEFVFLGRFAMVMWYTNSAVNFYMYAFVAEDLRAELYKMCQRRTREVIPATSLPSIRETFTRETTEKC